MDALSPTSIVFSANEEQETTFRPSTVHENAYHEDAYKEDMLPVTIKVNEASNIYKKFANVCHKRDHLPGGRDDNDLHGERGA